MRIRARLAGKAERALTAGAERDEGQRCEHGRITHDALRADTGLRQCGAQQVAERIRAYLAEHGTAAAVGVQGGQKIPRCAAGMGGEGGVAVAVRAINLQQRGVDRPTDVLSFPMFELAPGTPPALEDVEADPGSGLVPLGDMVLSLERVSAQAKEYGLIDGIVALEGAVFGVLGVGYNKTLLWLHDREAGQTLIPDRWRALPPLLFAGCLALFAPLLIGGGESLIIFVGEHDVALKTLILLLAFKYLFAQYSTVASIPGGLLMPILCLGALWGRLWAELPVSALAAHGLASGSVQPYVLFGMVSYFAATVRAPLTGIVLVTEMSGTYTCLPGSLLAGLIACKVANLLHCPPVYDSLNCFGTGVSDDVSEFPI